MKLTLNYQNGILNIPVSAADAVKTATRTDMAVLLCVAAEPAAMADFDSCADAIALRAGITKEELTESVAFWRGAGVFTVVGGIPEPAPKKHLEPLEMPRLTAADVAEIIEKTPERKGLIDACQQTMGKMFNTAECSVILGLKEYLGVDDEYILMVAAYCARREKKSVKYLEKTAISMYDREIDTTAALEEHLVWLETKDAFESKLRRLLGTGTRSFSKKEKDSIDRWVREYAFDFDVIELAYGKTVDAIGKASVPYMDRILGSWHEKGYKTASDVELGESGGKPVNTENFDTDDFFRLAVKRGLEL